MHTYITICDMRYNLLLQYPIVLAHTDLYQFLLLQGSHDHGYYLYQL